MMPSYSRVLVWEQEARAAKGDTVVDAAFRAAYQAAGLSGTERKEQMKVVMAKWDALRKLDPSVELPQKTRDAVKAAGGTARFALPVTPLPVANVARPFQSAIPPKPASPARPAVDGSLRGVERMAASIRRDMAAGIHGLQRPATDDDPFKIPVSLASIPPVGRKVARLDVDQLGALACEIFGEVETNRICATSSSDAETLHRLERQYYIEGLKIPGQTAESFAANLRMSPPPSGIFGGMHRRQQTMIDAFIAFLESES